MKVDRVSANIRFSQEIQGTWKSVELGAEATLTPNEDWHEAQTRLYAELTTELRSL